MCKIVCSNRALCLFVVHRRKPATISQQLCQEWHFRLRATYAPTLLVYKLDSLSNLPFNFSTLCFSNTELFRTPHFISTESLNDIRLFQIYLHTLIFFNMMEQPLIASTGMSLLKIASRRCCV